MITNKEGFPGPVKAYKKKLRDYKMKSTVIRISGEVKALLIKKREGFERPMDTLERLLGVKKKK